MERIKVSIHYAKGSEPQHVEIERDQYESLRHLMADPDRGSSITLIDFSWNPQDPREVTVNLRNVNQIVEIR